MRTIFVLNCFGTQINGLAAESPSECLLFSLLAGAKCKVGRAVTLAKVHGA